MSRREPILLVIGVAIGIAGMALWRRAPRNRTINWNEFQQSVTDLPAERREEWSDKGLTSLGDNLNGLTRVTSRPVRVDPVDWTLCVGPPGGFAPAPHSAFAIHIYATPGSEDHILRRRADYPEGTVVLKQKLTQTNETELFTGMLKREAGYNPGCGDWEFFVLSDQAQLLARGRIESCMNCHQDYADRGYLSLAWQTEEP